VESIYERCRDRGGEIVGDLEAKPWGVREFSIRDPDGHVLRIGGARVMSPTQRNSPSRREERFDRDIG
jgi:uncharacterized glyoxalase superfamily protein PhnB